MLAPPPTAPRAKDAGPPPPATLLANGLIELEPLWRAQEHPDGLPVYAKPGYGRAGAGAGPVVVARVGGEGVEEDGEEKVPRVRVVDLR